MIMRVARAFDSLIYNINKIIGHIFAMVLILLAIFVVLNVVTRWVGISVPWLFSLSIFILISFIFLGTGYTLGEGRHITVDVVTMHLPENSRSSLEILGYIFCLPFSLILFWQGTKWLYLAYIIKMTAGATSLSTLTIPFWVIILPVPIGGFLLSLQTLRLIVKRTYSLIQKRVDLKTSLMPPALVIMVFMIGILIAVKISPIGGLFLSLMAIILGGTPVAFGIATTGIAGLYLFAGGRSALPQIPMAAFGGIESFALAALPLFVLVGAIISHGGLAKTLFRTTELWLSHVRGSLLIVTIATGAIFCAITGSSVAATAIMSLLALPALLGRGFDRRLSCGTVGGASVGSLIPPSAALIVYGTIVEMSIGKLFMAALIPSLIVFFIFALYIIVLSYTNKEKFGRAIETVSWSEKFLNLKKSAPILFLPILILGGIYAGLFTATEAAGIAMIYGLIIVVFVMRSLKWRELQKALLDGFHISQMTIFILVGGVIFANVIAQLKIAPTVVSFAEAMGASRAIVTLTIFLFLLVGGMFMSSMEMMIITLPVFYPLAMSVGIDGLWLGVFYTVCIEIGLLTPPVGVNLFVMRGASGIPLTDIAIGMVPFIILLILGGIVMMYFFPQLCTWLPSVMVMH